MPADPLPQKQGKSSEFASLPSSRLRREKEATPNPLEEGERGLRERSLHVVRKEE